MEYLSATAYVITVFMNLYLSQDNALSPLRNFINYLVLVSN